jgi:hypothetical protein
MNALKQLLEIPTIASAVKFGSERRYYILAVLGCAYVYLKYSRPRNNTNNNSRKAIHQHHKKESSNGMDDELTQEVLAVATEVLGGVVMDDARTTSLSSISDQDSTSQLVISSTDQPHTDQPTTDQSITPTKSAEELEKENKKKRKKEKLKKTVLDGVGLVMGDTASKFVESIIDISQTAKKDKGGIESFVKSGKLGKLFSNDIVPMLKSKLQNKKFPTIVGTTDSPLGDLHYEVSGITLESLDVNPSLQCDITDGNEALQIRVMISSAQLRNIAWNVKAAKIKERGTANAEIAKAQCLFRISIDRSQLIPKLSIKHCSIELQQFNLELMGGKASWVYNILTTVFSNKIKTKLKEKIDKMLTKKCNLFETKINFAATRILSLFSDKEKKRKERAALEAPPVTPHKKCYLYTHESSTEEVDCILLDISPYTDIYELRTAFFGELGLSFPAHSRMRFRDRTGTLITVSKSTTIAQLVEHAEHVCFYKESSFTSSTSSNKLGYSSSSPSSSPPTPSLRESRDDSRNSRSDLYM